jgi:hypothetical protein
MFPRSGSRNLKFQYSWFTRFNWLAYSAKDDGDFCMYCVALGVEHSGKKETSLRKLVKKPFQNWKKALEEFQNHAQLDYHKKCVLDVEHLRDIARGKKTNR